jgi:hypothetical protein
MEHASFIIGSWALTFVSIGAYAAFVIRRGRELSRNATSEEMPWT